MLASRWTCRFFLQPSPDKGKLEHAFFRSATAKDLLPPLTSLLSSAQLPRGSESGPLELIPVEPHCSAPLRKERGSESGNYLRAEAARERGRHERERGQADWQTTDRQTDKQTDGQTDGQTDKTERPRQADRQTGRQTDRQTNNQTGRQTNRRASRQTDEPADTRADERTTAQGRTSDRGTERTAATAQQESGRTTRQEDCFTSASLYSAPLTQGRN